MQLRVTIEYICDYGGSLHFWVAVERWDTLAYIPITDCTWYIRINWAKMLAILIQTIIQTIARQCWSESILCTNKEFETSQASRGNCNPPSQQTSLGKLLLLHYLGMFTQWTCLGDVNQSLWLVWYLVVVLGETSWYEASGWRRQPEGGPWPVLPRYQSSREKPESPGVNLDLASSPA